MIPMYEQWTEKEINDYIDQFNVLVLFQTDLFSPVTKIIVKGKNLDYYQQEDLKYQVSSNFGSVVISDDVCDDINEFAQKWYNKNILKKKARIINKTKKSK